MTDTEIHKHYIELFVTAIKTSSFNDSLYHEEDSEEGKQQVFNHTPALFIDYLSLHESTDDYFQKVQSELDGIGKQRFKENHSVEDLSTSLERKVKALYQTIERMTPQREDYVTHAIINSEKALAKVYSFYRNKRAHKPKSDVILYEFLEGQILEVSHMLQVIGKGYLRLQVLEEIERHLEFNDFYSLNDKQIVESAAEACHRIWRKNHSIAKEHLLRKVLNEFHIKRYSEKSSAEKERLTKKAVNQWVRDNMLDSMTN